ncbi:7e04848b-6a22-4e39-8eaf-11731cba9fbb-CDS [Sclerotinia trifoliorum]|uniref:7e04848b-6a22-4e39-8eaf-11731cba9fbb-CDS n=1 Tax=Sclerotinia trifoliorum TaxID=28548 RepID=A0A8H2ZV37_9HELO|nr:7e04848b-6a22-4e39-8eaf-11731cba9fbb-CDS [Sclerotinia trifoliorum]
MFWRKERSLTRLRKHQKNPYRSLDDSFILLPGQGIMGGRCGNQFWRSPESWGKGRRGVLSDIFSMGIVAIYIMNKQMIFYDGSKDEDFVDGEACDQFLRRHISYFWDENDFTALWSILEDNPFHDRLIDIFNNTKNPRPPFRNWIKIDAELRDLVVKMARLDPTSRIGAREASEHPFFDGIGG